MSEVTAARYYILGFLSALKQTHSDQFDSYNKKWIKIDAIENDNIRHKQTITYYKTLSFVDGSIL